MINPNNDNLTRDEPLPTPLQSGEGEVGSSGREQFRRVQSKFSTAMSHTWEGTKDKAGRARERTEYFVRENPVPTILGALGLRSEEHTSELQSRFDLVCRLLLEKKKRSNCTLQCSGSFQF